MAKTTAKACTTLRCWLVFTFSQLALLLCFLLLFRTNFEGRPPPPKAISDISQWAWIQNNNSTRSSMDFAKISAKSRKGTVTPNLRMLSKPAFSLHASQANKDFAKILPKLTEASTLSNSSLSPRELITQGPLQKEVFGQNTQHLVTKISKSMRRTTPLEQTVSNKPTTKAYYVMPVIQPKRIQNQPRSARRSQSLIAKDSTEHRKKRRVSLVVAILTAPTRFDRRQGIRATWMKECNNPGVVCRFFTDPLSEMEPHQRNALINENRTNNDLEFMPIPKGYNFGRRMLWLMEWSAENYDFDYFLRVDDDYFVCLKKLLLELPHRPRKRYRVLLLHLRTSPIKRSHEK